jgi:hypothetical protein
MTDGRTDGRSPQRLSGPRCCEGGRGLDGDRWCEKLRWGVPLCVRHVLQAFICVSRLACAPGPGLGVRAQSRASRPSPCATLAYRPGRELAARPSCPPSPTSPNLAPYLTPNLTPNLTTPAAASCYVVVLPRRSAQSHELVSHPALRCVGRINPGRTETAQPSHPIRRVGVPEPWDEVGRSAAEGH